MATPIERLEGLAAFDDVNATGPWAFNGFDLLLRNGWERDYVLVALRSLPDLVKAARVLEALECQEGGPEWCWEQGDDWPDPQWCATCRALAPLFREVPS